MATIPNEMPFLDHLDELRRRLFWIVGSVVLGIIVGFFLLSHLDIIRVLQRPILPYLNGKTLIYTHPGTSFRILLNASLVLGILLALPVIAGQVWGFLSPALYKHEKKVIIPVIAGMVVLFLAGVSLSFFVVLPLTLKFLMGLESTSLTPMISASEYFNFAISMCLAFGLVFEVPIAVLALTALGIVTPAFLAKYRRHAVIICVIVSAFITPGADPYSMFALAIPLYILYEISVVLSMVIERKKRKRAERLEAEEAAEAREAARATPVAPAIRRLFGILLALIAVTGTAAAQLPGRIPPPTRDGIRVVRDTTLADSLAKDSTRAREIIKWAEPDSVMRALMARAGYSATRYQGQRVRYDAATRTLYLVGDPAAVGREPTILVGDTIVYNDSTKRVLALGDTLILRDPSQGNSDVVARGRMTYNVESRRGSVTDISTAVESGEKWYVRGAVASFVSDTSRGNQTAFYARDGSITSCDDSIPDYHFRAKQIKLVSKNLLVARPAVLYIGEVPVMWLPFIFQDMRSGRRSGILTPRFGVSELFRNSPSYRRHAENLGYYFALSEYMDGQVSMDWRSGSRPTDGDPGWVRFNGEWRYRWLDRFLTGRLATTHHSQRDGTTNTAVSLFHSQDFSQSTHFAANLNYVTNTTIQRRTTFDPRQVLATIRSDLKYDTKVGPASFSVGGTRTQYPGRNEVAQNFPNLSISTPTLSLRPWLEWTPTLSFNNDQRFNIDQAGEFAFRFLDRGNGVVDSVRLKRDIRNTDARFSTPVKIRGISWENSFTYRDQEFNAPASIVILDQNDTSRRSTRVFARTFSTEVDWQTSFSLPSFLHGTFNLSPHASFQNVDPHGFLVRTEQSGGRFVRQSKRLVSGIGMSPTLFALFPGFGPVTRFRHSLTPVVSYDFAPPAKVSSEFLRALNQSPSNYLGSLAQNRLTLTVSHALEAKLRNSDTSATAEATKLRVLAMNFTPLSYDFERARKTGGSGFVTDAFGYDVTSELIPGFRAGVQYSLYQGNVLSDSARFKPFRERMDVSFSLNGQSGIFGALNRVFGRAVPQGSPQMERVETSPDDAMAQRIASTPVAGSYVRNRQYAVPQTESWQAQFTFSSQRQRPPTGNGIIITEDPASRCLGFQVNPLQYQQCLEAEGLNSTGTVPITRTTAGGPFIQTPARDNLQTQMSFNITPKWSGQWGTNYDFQAKKFGSHSVTLQRELHDWRAIFAFNQAPNGNFAFNFFIALNAQPDLKFNYDKQTYRPLTR